jgi:hypothetical protein
MKLSLKSFKIGDRIYYRFPHPAADERSYLIGTIRRKGRNYVEVAAGDRKMRLENIHLGNIEAVERMKIKIN